MAVSVEVLNLAVIGPFVGHVEGGRYGAAVGIDTLLLEEILVEFFVQIIDRVVECQQHDLRQVL